jgi:arylamine N-acetyltransferase
MRLGMICDLPSYLARIGLASAPAATPQGLEQVQRAHRQSIGFENLDVMLGRGIALAPEAICGKLVDRRRGGYCLNTTACSAPCSPPWACRRGRFWRASGYAPRPA